MSYNFFYGTRLISIFSYTHRCKIGLLCLNVNSRRCIKNCLYSDESLWYASKLDCFLGVFFQSNTFCSIRQKKLFETGIKWHILHYEAKLCILWLVSRFRNEDAPFLILLIFLSLWPFWQNFSMFDDLFLESRNVQTQHCVPIQCTVWPRNKEIKRWSFPRWQLRSFASDRSNQFS